MAAYSNYASFSKYDSMLNDDTMNSDSDLNKAILMTSNDSLAETFAKPTDHSILAKNYDKNKEFEDLITNALEQSNIWPALTVLEHNLCTSADNINKENHEIMEKLYERYNYSPSDFTEHLITILEESFTEFNEEMNDSIDPDISMPSSSFVIYERPVEEESVPQSFFLLPNESTQYTNSSTASSIPVDSLNVENNTSINNSTLYLSYTRPEKLKKRIITFSTVPKILVNDKACTNSNIEPVQFSIKKNSSTRRSKAFRKTPKIYVQHATPKMKKIRNANCASPAMTSDDNDYMTLDSENNEETTMVKESGTSINESVNMSKVAFFHDEWVNAYEKLASYKPMNSADSSLISDRKRKIDNHANKLERQWLRELSKKRQKCFDVVNELMHNIGNDSVESKRETNLSFWYQNMQFYDTLMAVSDYFTYAKTCRESLESEARGKRNRRSFPKSPIYKTKKNGSNFRTIGTVTKRTSGKSLATKVMPLKSPGANKRKSLRMSVTKSRTEVPSETYAMMSRDSLESEKPPTHSAKKNVSNFRDTSNLTEKTSNELLAKTVTPLKSRGAKKRKSLRRSITKIRIGATPEIDRTSIQPVHKLRMLYSPKSRIPGKAYSTTKIPLPKQGIWKSYLTDPSRKPATTNAAAGTVDVRGLGSTTKFKNVKSPVGEYIRGKK